MLTTRKEKGSSVEIDTKHKHAVLETFDSPIERSSSLPSPDRAREQKGRPAQLDSLAGASHLPLASASPEDSILKRKGRKGNRRKKVWKPLGEDLSAEGSTFSERSQERCTTETENLGFCGQVTNVGSGSTNKKMEDEDVKDEKAIMKRLLDLELSTKEFNISQYEQDTNRQEQSDEVVALEAIFGENFITLDANDSAAQTYMVCIHVEVSTSLNVMVMLNGYSDRSQEDVSEVHALAEAASNNNSSQKPGRFVGRLHACTLQFLPPIHLVCRLPKSYPSHSPPAFVLSARWLTQRMLSSLCQGLDDLWEQQVGEVVIYSWAEWLRTSCLSHLKITDELELHINREETADRRALSGFLTPDMDIPWLIRYNEDHKNNEFINSLHSCFICFTDQSGKDMVRLPCKHMFCGGCLKQYAKINVKEGTVKKLRCPDTSCRDSIPPTILKQLLEEDDFSRWESLLLQKTLDSMADVVYCPRCEAVCIEDDDHYAQCAGCLFSFCSLCRGPRHVGQECMTAETRLLILKERQETSHRGKDRRRKEDELLNELLSMRYVQKETKQCPACKMAISKSEGCNKITCGNCGQYFCYLCNEPIKGYDHFSEGCVLFDQNEVEHWEYIMNIRHGAHGARMANQGAEGARDELWRPCPNCRQPNPKEGNNNHIFCVSCQKHYCALCRKVVRRSSEHYGAGPNKCRQHTTD